MLNRLKKCLLLGLGMVCMNVLGWSQKSANSSDCFGALEIVDTMPRSISIEKGHGYFNDFIHFPDGFPIKDNNIVWLQLEAPYDSYFAFDIEHNPEEAVKFMLFHTRGYGFCDQLGQKFVRPEVINTRSNDGKCGLKREEAKGYSQALKVQQNDLLFLAVNAENDGVKIQFKPHFIPFKNTHIVEKKHKVYNLTKDPTKPNLVIELIDDETEEPVYANVTFDGNRLDKYAFSGSLFKFDIQRTGTLKMEINAKGYFFETKEFELKGSEGAEFTVKMVRLEKGKKLNLPDVKFKMGTDEFLPTAFTTLKRLFDFLMLNSDIRVEIQGHVNGPNMENNNAMQRLSEKRAKAVYHYLIDNGIDKDRLQHRGFGNTQMVDEHPKTVDDEEKNRRVEIEII